MKRVIWFLLVLILLVPVNDSFADDDFQYWSQFSFKPYKTEKATLTLFTDSRLTHDVEKLGLYLVSPRLTYHYSKNLDLGLNYTYIQSRSTSSTATDDSYNRQHRSEVEINPHWKLKEFLNLKMRNRVEFRWIEGKGSDNTRYRQRWLLNFPVENIALLKSFYVSSEIFYEFNEAKFKENRTVPIGLKFKINENVNFDMYYLIQSRKGSNDWSSNQILGTHFAISF